ASTTSFFWVWNNVPCHVTLLAAGSLVDTVIPAGKRGGPEAEPRA
ncbi:unnamed protein product, partial [marine sediment metagenome]